MSAHGAQEVRVGGGKYVLGKKIGSGAFGDIYQCVDIGTGQQYGVKLEPIKSKHPQLFYEYKVYKLLQGGLGIPQVVWFGVEGDFNVMVMELLGPSLEDLFAFCGQHLSLKTVLMLADQMMRRVEFVHTRNFLHRDIKPDNFLMGVGVRSTQVYIIDFGLAKRFRDVKTRAHIPYKENKSLTGTARYASVNAHLGIEQSRRDDLESIGYVLMYFLRGSLPWQGLKADNKHQKYERISEKKLATTVEQLCKGFPPELTTFLKYTKSLRFEDKPDYSYLRKLLRDLFIREGYKYDGMYDWTLIQLNNKANPGRQLISTTSPYRPADQDNAAHGIVQDPYRSISTGTGGGGASAAQKQGGSEQAGAAPGGAGAGGGRIPMAMVPPGVAQPINASQGTSVVAVGGGSTPASSLNHSHSAGRSGKNS
eukprot:TRINITY_DN779_c0_g2_i5.p1 TRINITY_DN779_c0_g2~~TRINITY_DN779_c0_g2_i5.p1  ORF type:complete len:441 (+),score=119.70 TRINITY_DN779_c0_g2_i5:59-1324(+)